MNNYSKLLTLEKDLKFIKNGLVEKDVFFLDKLELYHCLYVVNIYTGEMGYIQRNLDNSLNFIISLTGASIPVTEQELNDNFIETPKHLLNVDFDNPRFILNPYKDSVGIIPKTNHEARYVDVVWKDKTEPLDIANVIWITKIVGVEKL